MRLAVLIVGLAGLIGPALMARAAIYDSGGFEAFTLGDLSGQDPANGPWQKSGTNSSTGTVQTAVVQSGVKAVQLTRAAAVNGDVRFGVVKPLANVVTPIAIDWDMNVTQSNLPPTSFGPFFGVEGYDALDNPPLLAGSLGVDATTGEVLYQQTTTGFFLAVPNFTVAFGQWNHYRLLLDYGTGHYSIFVNGSLKATEPFVDPNVFDFTDAPLAGLAAAGDPVSLAAGGSAYYDNYVISQVPEPTLALGAVVGLGFLRRKRFALATVKK
jgi:hypothetical protein